MRYRDVAGAVEWLRSRLGFELHSSVRDDDGVMVYAQVAFGNAMVMLAPIQDTALDRYMRQPDEIGGAETQSCYFYVADAAAHFARAKNAGAEIILPLEPYDSGGQGYSCRDPEGHIWTFGDFDPWGRDGGDVTVSAALERSRPRRRRLARAMGVLAVLGASGAAAAWYSGADFASVVGSTIHSMQERPSATVAIVRETSTDAANALQERLTAEVAAREAAEETAKAAAVDLERERGLSEAVRREMSQLKKRVSADLERERGLSEAVRREMSQLQSRLSVEEAARTEAEAKLANISVDVERERAGREYAERKAQAEAATAASHQAARLIAEAAAREAEAEKVRSAKSSVTVTPDDTQEKQRLLAAHEAAEAAVRRARDEAQRERTARGAAEKAAQGAVRRAETAEAASAAAEATMTELRSQLATEQAAKRSAWNAINALRKQVSQIQRAKAAAANDADGGAEPAATAAGPPRKQVQRRQQPRPARKQRPRQQAPAED